ncbi:PEP-CTERM sorting domain-containing protein [Candidatus Gracilibacteria bacterium]|nr:PEP-CTERM sorting domain-containing protein [Candidatus Gracilibacteria bacterium]NJM88813.1 PEP-CTERM sorting domain-containing protein [Hydrococcus sp. RU_2_2]NJP19352.1 PEP-CTERM sorting domain-containing protein [Hydrococcus sp. CRU_1_1]
MAGIFSTTGISQISAPSTTDYPKASNLQVFEESSNIVFSNDDIALDAGTIASDTLVDSYNIYFHPESNSSSWKTASGSITFDSEILGLIWSKSNLEASDTSLGTSGTPYAQIGDWRGLEEKNNPDLSGLSNFIVNGGGKTLNLSFNVRETGYDELRVITAATPEPLTILGASTAIGFGVFFKRKLAKGKNGNSVS